MQPQKPSFLHYFRKAKLLVIIVLGLILIPIVLIINKNNESKGLHAERIQDFSHVCSKDGKAISNAAAYKSGTAPYPATIMLQSVSSDPDAYRPLSVARGSAAVSEAIRERNVENIQVVGCVSRVSETQTSQTCDYQGVTLTVYDATYQLTAYEAKTREIIKSAEIPTEQDYSCTSMAAYDTETKRAYKQPVLAAIGSELESAVQP